MIPNRPTIPPMPPLRVCLVSRELSPFWGGGIGVYARNMAAAWAECGHEVHLLCPAHPGLTAGSPDLPTIGRCPNLDAKSHRKGYC